MPVNEKILFRSLQYLFSPKSIIYAICRRQCCTKITLFFWGKNIDFRGGGGGGINIRFRPKYRPLVVDPHHFDADSDSIYHPDADPDSEFHLMRIRIQIKLPIKGSNPSSLSLWCGSESKVLFDADADPAYQNDADPDPQHWREYLNPTLHHTRSIYQIWREIRGYDRKTGGYMEIKKEKGWLYLAPQLLRSMVWILIIYSGSGSELSNNSGNSSGFEPKTKPSKTKQ